VRGPLGFGVLVGCCDPSCGEVPMLAGSPWVRNHCAQCWGSAGTQTSQSQGRSLGKGALGVPHKPWLQLRRGYGNPPAPLCSTSCRGLGEEAGSPPGAGQKRLPQLSCREPSHLAPGLPTAGWAGCQGRGPAGAGGAGGLWLHRWHRGAPGAASPHFFPCAPGP